MARETPDAPSPAPSAAGATASTVTRRPSSSSSSSSSAAILPASTSVIQATGVATAAAPTSSSSSSSSSSSPATIQIYARVRPVRANSKNSINPDRYWCNNPAGNVDASSAPPRIGFRVPKDQAAGMINNQRETYDFRFDRIFDMDSGQEEIFDVVAKPVVLSVMDGYNGTIFAYGQTGSGKTFTITGGAERYADRGIIPRTLQFIFKEMQKRHDHHYELSVSYLEIYNEVAYDLLDDTREAKKLEDLPKVSLQEDDGGNIHLRNLSCIAAKDEEEALNLLFVGDTNRMIAETPSNPASSRSHCLFIITIMGRKEGEDTIRRSKLHLVDLAGSERTSKTGINGTLLKEAKYINLSLHYLEQVIIALHEKALGRRTHVPYRNSMMTSVLRDSLGGNCRTTMVATVAVEDMLIDESISTCRFAQRVALIANNAQLNEELDPRLLIARLKREVARLKTELAIARGEAGEHAGEELPDYEKERVKDAVNDYLADSSADAALLFADGRKISEAFRIMKELIAGGTRSGAHNNNERTLPAPPRTNTATPVVSPPDGEESAEVERFRRLIAHRDNEINILVEMVNKLRNGEDVDKARIPAALRATASVPANIGQTEPITRTNSFAASSMPALTHSSTARLAASVPQLTTEKAKAFDIFKQGYPSGAWIEGQKTLLKGKYTEAKALGEKANQLRTDIKSMKSMLAEGGTDDNQDPNSTSDLRARVADSSAQYKHAYQQLKELKLEIEHLQHLLEQARHRLTRDFEHWYANVYLPTAAEEARETSAEDEPSRRPASPPQPPPAVFRASSFAASGLTNTSRYDSALQVTDVPRVASSSPSGSLGYPRSGFGEVDAGIVAGIPQPQPFGAYREPPVLPKYIYPPNLNAAATSAPSPLPTDPRRRQSTDLGHGESPQLRSYSYASPSPQPQARPAPRATSPYLQHHHSQQYIPPSSTPLPRSSLPHPLSPYSEKPPPLQPQPRAARAATSAAAAAAGVRDDVEQFYRMREDLLGRMGGRLPQ
ncbi:Kinesin- protein 6 [Geranomyces michiganensis]|nr:Kinesin- protein 6 [Geranomyces michiganensis]